MTPPPTAVPRHVRSMDDADARTRIPPVLTMVFIAVAALSWQLFGFGEPAPTTSALPISNMDQGKLPRSQVAVAAAAEPAPRTALPSAPPAQGSQASPAPHSTAPYQISVVAGGDVLIHRSLWRQAHQGGDRYDFSDQLAGLKNFISGADLALCGFESPVRPTGQPLSTFPRFGAPKEIVRNLKDIGFDGCSTANNHSIDHGFASIEATIGAFKEVGMGFSGTATSAQEGAQIPMYVVHKGDDEVRIAHISYTALSNLNHTAADQQWAFNSLEPYGPMTIDNAIADAARARQLGADIVLVSLHWGSEYTSAPGDIQREIGQALAESGQVDVILGSHPHVPQPIEKLPGGPQGRGTWVAWSMGNMFSGQIPSMFGFRVTTGYLATITIDVSAQGASIGNVEWTAVTTDSPKAFSAYLLDDLLANNTTTLTSRELQRRAEVTHEVMDPSSPQRTEAPVAGGDSLTIERLPAEPAPAK